MLLAFTSATDFLAHIGERPRLELDPLSVDHEIRVVARGSWGELRFRRIG